MTSTHTEEAQENTFAAQSKATTVLKEEVTTEKSPLSSPPTSHQQPASPPHNQSPAPEEEKASTLSTELYTISVLVQNKPGVLGRISLIFSRRGFNIESLVVSATRNPAFSRFTITVKGNKDNLDQVIRHIRKLVNVLKAHHFDHINTRGYIERELALIKIILTNDYKNIFAIIDHFKATTIDLTQNSMVVQITGTTEKIDAFLKILESYQIMEIIRTGKVLIRRGKQAT
ncbi:acetolactate synthase small subunit [Spirochaetota bacterium]|nr:acetolactate synthase small subunit [Spirochaetota bacterium]